jgi:hypothetical protein
LHQETPRRFAGDVRIVRCLRGKMSEKESHQGRKRALLHVPGLKCFEGKCVRWTASRSRRLWRVASFTIFSPVGGSFVAAKETSQLCFMMLSQARADLCLVESRSSPTTTTCRLWRPTAESLGSTKQSSQIPYKAFTAATTDTAVQTKKGKRGQTSSVPRGNGYPKIFSAALETLRTGEASAWAEASDESSEIRNQQRRQAKRSKR